MDMPYELKAAAEELVEGINPSRLRKIAQELSDRYRNSSASGKTLLSEELEASVYSLVRMPATYGAVSASLKYALEFYDGPVCNTLLDVGAGSGSGSWAVNYFDDSSRVNINKITCLEREAAMRTIGSKLMKSGDSVLSNAEWRSFDLTSNSATSDMISADIVLESYVLNELSPSDRHKALDNLWAHTNNMLLLVEPGSKIGFGVLKDAREYLLAEGASLIAPCPHTGECRLDSDDWCHFTCRVQRSKIHKLLKDGDVPYEDEKFSFMCFAKSDSQVRRATSRILRHPQISKGQIGLTLCGSEKNEEVVIRKRDGEAFKVARKASQGDSFDY
ncbi:MAG: small ribosomal subunit Rsm22 family protein [Clostridia bacterium]|nr:small ribosomal subunit Rsm22 family protein [Clostridia bacterium]